MKELEQLIQLLRERGLIVPNEVRTLRHLVVAIKANEPLRQRKQEWDDFDLPIPQCV